MTDAVTAAFDQVLVLNPWARALAADMSGLARRIRRGDVELIAARQSAALHRLAESPLAWSLWANGMVQLQSVFARDLAGRDVWAGLAVCDLGRGRLASLDLAGRVFPAAVLGGGVICRGDVWANAAQFLGGVHLAGAEIGGDLTIEASRFVGPVALSGAKITGSVQMRGVQCLAAFDASGAVIGADVWARDGVMFGGPTRFDAVQFGREAGFGDAVFGGPARFDGADFAGNAGFEGAIFSVGADFSDALFQRGAWFGGARFDGPARFDRARLRGRFDLSDARFADAADQARAAAGLLAAARGDA